MPLIMVTPGRRVRMVAVHAGRGLQARLAAMGLLPGTEIEVVSGCVRGPLVVSVRGSRLMLGRGIAQRIMVE